MITYIPEDRTLDFRDLCILDGIHQCILQPTIVSCVTSSITDELSHSHYTHPPLLFEKKNSFSANLRFRSMDL